MTALTPEQTTLTLELANIISGSASTTLAMLIDQPIAFSQPTVTQYDSVEELATNAVAGESLLAVLELESSFNTPMAFILDAEAVKCIATAMMGADTGEAGITEMHLSAFGEAISQMTGAMTNSLSTTIGQAIEMTSPEVSVFSVAQLLQLLNSNSFVAIQYKITGGTSLADCTLLQVTSQEGLQAMLNVMGNATVAQGQAASEEMMNYATPPVAATAPQPEQIEPVAVGVTAGSAQAADTSYYTQPSGGQSPMSSAYAGGGGGSVHHSSAQPVTVQPVEFPSFENHVPAYGAINKNLELVMDVCLNLTVELGRTELPIKDVLELTRGSVIELNRVAGEPVDLFANGKMIAKGEVVVIEDNFGLRITSIVSPADRLRGL